MPALDGVVAKLERGARVADVGCGHGISTMLMAKAFPNSEFVGYDFHPSSIEHAQAHAKENGVSGNTHFEVATSKDYPGKDFDLVVVPGAGHGMGGAYGTRRMHDFFVRHLLGAEPPDRNAGPLRRRLQ